jgi:hypothetical protein
MTACTQVGQFKRKLSALDKADLAWLMKEMIAGKIFHLKVGDIELQASQYAFVPKPEAIPAAPQLRPAPLPEPADYPELSAPFQAFRPWAPKKEQPVETRRIDPSDPDSPLDDDALFGSDLPQAN